MLHAIYYILSIVAANVAFTVLPAIPLPGGGILPAATFAVGLTFIFRDLVQKALGHGVLIAMAAATFISFLMADPTVVWASVVAFVAAELVDYGVYTVSKRPLRDRIILSSLLSTPVDSVVFLALLPFPGTFSLSAIGIMTAAKLSVAGGWWLYLRGKDEHVST